MSSPKWQKSSYCEAASSCLYLAAAPNRLIRSREGDAPDNVLTTTPNRLRPLISAIKANAYDHGHG
ncbi:DUF397 domain-containing protein [Streptomyces cinnamoneus]|uniref:DUF397 domain-containing protein n=1 Tax=Streptomyces cinnamoneus TaxID=53446 RepID=UPI0033F30245